MINNDEIKIPEEYYANSTSNIDLSWINDIEGYKEIAREADSYYMKGKNDNELKLIKDFITKINNKAGNEFRK